MDVLEAAAAVVARRDAEQPLQLLGPRAGYILDPEVARDQPLLQAIAEDHVGRIRDLVGFDADEAAGDTRVDLPQVLRLPGGA